MLNALCADTGLEWAGARERDAIAEENSGFLGCYLAVTERAYEAQRIARERQAER